MMPLGNSGVAQSVSGFSNGLADVAHAIRFAKQSADRTTAFSNSIMNWLDAGRVRYDASLAEKCYSDHGYIIFVILLIVGAIGFSIGAGHEQEPPGAQRFQALADRLDECCPFFSHPRC